VALNVQHKLGILTLHNNSECWICVPISTLCESTAQSWSCVRGTTCTFLEPSAYFDGMLQNDSQYQ